MSEKNRGEIYLGSQFGRFQLKINPGSRLEVREGLMEERTGWGQPGGRGRWEGCEGKVSPSKVLIRYTRLFDDGEIVSPSMG